MAFIDIYEQYKHLLTKKTQERFQMSFNLPKVTFNKSKSSSPLFLFCKVRDKFDQIDAVHEICKDLNYLSKTDALMAVHSGIRLSYTPAASEPTPGYAFWEPSYTHFEDARHVGSCIYVLDDVKFDITNKFATKYSLAEGAVAPFFPEFQVRKCVCGVDKIYGAKALKQMHSGWCPLNKYDR